MRLFALFLLLLFALLTFGLRHAAEPAAAKPADLRLSTIASAIARRHVSVRCEGAGGDLTNPEGASGTTEFVNGKPANDTVLQEGICETLHDYSRLTKESADCGLPCDGSALETAWSLNALAHESYHLAGVRNEAQTECYALQAIDFVARQLGATSDEARQLAAFAFEELPPRMPDEYSSPQCRNGGEYDLRPQSSVWP